MRGFSLASGSGLLMHAKGPIGVILGYSRGYIGRMEKKMETTI